MVTLATRLITAKFYVIYDETGIDGHNGEELDEYIRDFIQSGLPSELHGTIVSTVELTGRHFENPTIKGFTS